MKNIKLIFCIWIVIGLFLVGCGRKNQEYSIDLIVKGSNTEFWQNVYEGAKAASEVYGVKVNMYGPAQESNYRDQIHVLEKSIARRPDAIIFAAGDYDLMAAPMEKAVDAGIPVIMVDSAVNSNKWVSFVTTDNEQAGKQLAEELIKRLGNRTGQIGVVSFVKGAYPALPRETGFKKAFEGLSQFNILETKFCDSNFDLAEEQTLQLIRDKPDLIAIAGLNAQSATGAGRALKRAGREDILLVGIDCTIEMAEHIEDGILRVAILQQPYLMGYYSLETTVKYLKGLPIDHTVFTGTYVVDQSNLFSKESQQMIFPFKK